MKTPEELPVMESLKVSDLSGDRAD
jgi:hypothetical protein